MTHNKRTIQQIYQSYLQYVGVCLFEDKNELVTALKQATRNVSGPP